MLHFTHESNAAAHCGKLYIFAVLSLFASLHSCVMYNLYMYVFLHCTGSWVHLAICDAIVSIACTVVKVYCGVLIYQQQKTIRLRYSVTCCGLSAPWADSSFSAHKSWDDWYLSTQTTIIRNKIFTAATMLLIIWNILHTSTVKSSRWRHQANKCSQYRM